MKIRALIVDDEPLARRRILSLLTTEPEIEVVGECSDGASAVATILETKPDLLFLDVQMPELDGFAVLERVCSVHLPLVVFVTAYDRYAVKAFETHALDYLLKPFKRKRFFEAIGRAKQALTEGTRDAYLDKVAELFHQLKSVHDRLVVKASGRIVLLRPEEVDWIEAAANYVRLHVGQQSYAVRDSISAFEKKLDPARFLRIHRSVIVNVDRIRELQPCNGSEYIVLLRDGKELPLGRSHREHVEAALRLPR